VATAQGGTAERQRERGRRHKAARQREREREATERERWLLIEITLDRSHSVCPSVERVKPVTKERSTWGDHQFVSS
jgi:hypothetical protein